MIIESFCYLIKYKRQLISKRINDVYVGKINDKILYLIIKIESKWLSIYFYLFLFKFKIGTKLKYHQKFHTLFLIQLAIKKY